MVAYMLTLLAGMMVGVAGLRIWQAVARAKAAQSEDESPVAEQISIAPDADLAGGPRKPFRLAPKHALLAAGAIAVAAIGVRASNSDNDSTPALAGPPVSMNAADKQQSLADVDSMIGKLAERLKANPDDGEGQRMLGWSYVMTGQPEAAIEPYKAALRLLPGEASVHEGYGEALVGVAKGSVTEAARLSFEQAIKLNPTEPRARYFLAMWQAQHGQERAALDKWIALANSGPADAPWQTDLRHQIDTTASELGVDVSARLKNPATPAAVSGPPPLDPAAMSAGRDLPAAQQQAMVNGMVERLAGRLKANPQDAEGWVNLLRSRMVLKQSEQAATDLALARKALKGADLARVNAAAREFGVRDAR